MTLTVTSIVLAAFALTLATLAPRRRSLAGAALLFAIALALPVHAPTLLAGATLVAAETAGVAEAGALLAGACVGLAAIAAPHGQPVVAGVVAIALVGAMVRRAFRSRPTAARMTDLAVRASVAAAVAAEGFPGHRLSDLARVASLTIGASLAFVALVTGTHAASELAKKRHRAGLARHARRNSTRPGQAEAAPVVAPSQDDLALALRRIVHELRQPVGAASNALATGGLATTDAVTAQALRDLAASELQSALASLESLARFARISAGEPVALPAVDAVEIALGAHANRVALDRSFQGTIAVDPAPLGYALDALVQNACDASPERTPLVTLRDDEDPAFVVLTISDEGHAPDPAALREAHRPFFTTRAGRLGLGASRAARYAASMGGRFVLRREGARTLAELHLPRKRGT